MTFQQARGARTQEKEKNKSIWENGTGETVDRAADEFEDAVTTAILPYDKAKPSNSIKKTSVLEKSEGHDMVMSQDVPSSRALADSAALLNDQSKYFGTFSVANQAMISKRCWWSFLKVACGTKPYSSTTRTTLELDHVAKPPREVNIAIEDKYISLRIPIHSCKIGESPVALDSLTAFDAVQIFKGSITLNEEMALSILPAIKKHQLYIDALIRCISMALSLMSILSKLNYVFSMIVCFCSWWSIANASEIPSIINPLPVALSPWEFGWTIGISVLCLIATIYVITLLRIPSQRFGLGILIELIAFICTNIVNDSQGGQELLWVPILLVFLGCVILLKDLGGCGNCGNSSCNGSCGSGGSSGGNDHV